MRDPKRINEILKLIEIIWVKQPDLRLMQLLGNVLPQGDNYYVEDNVLTNYLTLGYQTELNEKIMNDKNKKQTTRKNIRSKSNKKCKCDCI